MPARTPGLSSSGTKTVSALTALAGCSTVPSLVRGADDVKAIICSNGVPLFQRPDGQRYTHLDLAVRTHDVPRVPLEPVLRSQPQVSFKFQATPWSSSLAVAPVRLAAQAEDPAATCVRIRCNAWDALPLHLLAV
jgi:hypothetical protein